MTRELPRCRACGAWCYVERLPFLMARYWPDTWAFRITPLNERARSFYGGGAGPFDCTEREFVTDLYAMRALRVDEMVLRTRNDIRPPE